MPDEIEIPLKNGEKKEKIDFLKRHKFSDFKIHPYRGYIKHGVDMEEIEKVYPKFDKIIGAFKRPATKGYKYSFIYQLEETKSLVLCFFLDENPPKLFNAYYDYTKQNRKLKKKFEKWLRREFFNKRQ